MSNIEHPKRLWAIQTRPGNWSYAGLEATAKDCRLRGLVVVEYAPVTDTPGAVKELRALFEEADYQAQREYPTPERLREALLRADAWLTANGGQ
jgi:hypothetical protein